ncbi:hypothetical protein DSO57_1011350 [Entomophthora muscae]|uniref:Uncharacterized protein n=1 Tax=Entomophthora muscae TaxID=34485 RepID=A0ACC2U4P9_9FUNG|nr:hypothetical protein DSO57_1011350 [Entomophthora muscae]
MRGILFLSWFLAYFLPVVLALENPTPTTDWYNSSPDDAHQKESLAKGWFKYPSGHWGRKFQYGCLFTTPPAKPTLVRPYASFYLLMYLVGYYLLGCFSSMFGRFAYLGHLGHLAMVTVPNGSGAYSLPSRSLKTAYSTSYKVKALELFSSNASRAPLPEYQVGDLVLYYQNCTGGCAHKLESLWVGPCEVTYKKGVEYTVKLLSSGCPFA